MGVYIKGMSAELARMMLNDAGMFEIIEVVDHKERVATDLIKREDAIEAIRKERNIKALLDIPSIDIEPKRGKWVYDMNQYYKCTNCGHLTLMPDSGSVFVPDWDEYHFCPNCGARMKGADDE